ncbi:MAG TPA: glycoside hydrolase family 9 protein [Steroidobacteraceae bacterium]|nr:glycoside hydrolase family 9 protein [Steroidobacteraceae bacterium]
MLSLILAGCDGAATPGAAQAAEAPAPARAQAASLPGIAGIPFDAHILVDQFGYRPADSKVAVIRDPRVGFDSAEHFTPGPRYQVRSADDGGVVLEGAPTKWHGGGVDASAGDAGWWFDFGKLQKDGTYFIYDDARKVRSATFRIAPLVYVPVLKAAVKTLFYQRSGFSKQAPAADACWVDDAAFVGPGQDLEARDVTDRGNAAKARNVFGGWFDAGDTNKYVTFASVAVHQLLSAYQDSPTAFTDDFGIPESGNGVPDLLDEVKWETDWLRRMQNADGSVALKVGTLEYTRGVKPSLDRNARFYIPSCSSSTIAAAGMYAHAALVFGSQKSLAQDSTDLRARAERAWRQFHASPRQTNCDSTDIKAGDADWNEQDQAAEAVVAAVYLAALTGNKEYDDYVKAHYRETKSYQDIGWSRYGAHQGEALLFYARQSGVDPKTAAAIAADKSSDMAAGNQIYGMNADDDLYRSFMHEWQYHWGSNQVRANYGNTNVDAARLGSNRAAEQYLERARSTLHYFHGVNPFGMVYLSNMYRYGATRSINEIFHSWFWRDTRWSNAVSSPCGPAPGFVPGGPNVNAKNEGIPATMSPPVGQPRQKSYRDFNAPWPEGSWAVSEPGIYYQAAYIRLLSRFAY